MHVHCPHCHHPIEIVADTPLGDLTCPSCGSGFSLMSAETGPYDHTQRKAIGHFELIQSLGAGAFGTVWKARDTRLDRPVAVKIPRRQKLDPAETEQFFREARAAAQLRHPGIVAVHEVGRDGDDVYIVSDLVEGVTLADWLSARRLTPREAAELAAAIADALHHAHQAGVVHRDLKPANVMLDTDGKPHLMDFGLAKREAGEITMTVEGRILGTPAYMSPEQARGEGHQADRRSDIYSLGAVLFELLTGERPFRGNQRMLLHQVIHDDPPSPRRLNGNVPRDLETICLKCLQKDPKARYQTAAEVADDLRRYLDGRPIQARPVGRVVKATRWCRRNPVVAGLLATAAGLLAAVAAVSFAAYLQEAEARVREAEARAREAGLLDQVKAERTAAVAAGETAARQRDAARKSLYTAHVVLAQQAWQSSDVRQVLALLDPHRPAAGLSDLRGWEWYYLRSLCNQEVRTLRGHEDEIADLAWSPDGRRIATGGYDTRLGVWDIATGTAVVLKEAGNDRIVSVSWRPDGELLATAAQDGQVKLWDPGTGTEVASDRLHTGLAYVAWSPVGDRLATGGKDRTVRIRDGLGRVLVTHRVPGEVRGLSWSADGRRLAVAIADRPARVLDAASGEVVKELAPAGRSGKPEPPSSVAWSPDGETLVTVQSPRGLTVWQADDFTRLFSLEAQNENPTIPSALDVAWSPDSRYLSMARSTVGDGGGFAVLDVQEKRQTRGFRTGSVSLAAWSRDGKLLATAGKDGTVKLWDAGRDQEFAESADVENGCDMVTWGPDGRHLVSGGWWLGPDPAIVWQFGESAGPPVVVHRRDEKVTAVGWAPDGRRLALGTDDDVLVVGTEPGAKPRRLTGHTKQVNAVAWFHGQLASASHDTLITIWDPDTGAEVRTLKGHTEPVLAIDWNRTGTRLASTGHDHTIRIWDAASGAEVRVLDGHPGNTVMGVRWSPDGKRLASCGGMQAKVWDAESGRLLFDLSGHMAPVTGLTWHPGGKRLATCGFDQTVRMWDTESGQLLLTLRPRENFPRTVTWSPDGRHLAAGTGNRLTVWSAADAPPVRDEAP